MKSLGVGESRVPREKREARETRRRIEVEVEREKKPSEAS